MRESKYFDLVLVLTWLLSDRLEGSVTPLYWTNQCPFSLNGFYFSLRPGAGTLIMERQSYKRTSADAMKWPNYSGKTFQRYVLVWVDHHCAKRLCVSVCACVWKKTISMTNTLHFSNWLCFMTCWYSTYTHACLTTPSLSDESHLFLTITLKGVGGR